MALFIRRLVAYASAISGWGEEDTFGSGYGWPSSAFDDQGESSRVWAVIVVFCLVMASLLLLLTQRSYPSYAVWWLSYGYLCAVGGTLGAGLLKNDDRRRSGKPNFRETLPVQAIATALRRSATLLALVHILVSARDAAR